MAYSDTSVDLIDDQIFLPHQSEPYPVKRNPDDNQLFVVGSKGTLFPLTVSDTRNGLQKRYSITLDPDTGYDMPPGFEPE